MKFPICILFICLPLFLAAEIQLGGSTSTAWDAVLSSVDQTAPCLEGSLELALQLNVDSELFTLALEPGFSYNWKTQALTFVLNRAELLLSPGDFLTFAIGRFLYKPG